MPETTTERLVAIVGLVAAVAMLAAALSARNQRAAVAVSAPLAVQPLPIGTRTQQPVAAVTARPATKAPAPADVARLVLRAARGDCWLSIRVGTPDGAVVYEGVLTAGRTLRVQGTRLWVRLGAAANLDVALNGKPVTTPAAGTLDVVVTPAGIRPAT